MFFLFLNRREQQLSTAVERNDYLNEELSSERHSNSVLRKKVESANQKMEEMTNQNNYLENLVLRYEQVSISSTFYASLLRTKVFCAAFLYLQFGFVIFLGKNIGAKAALKMLAKSTIGLIFISNF